MRISGGSAGQGRGTAAYGAVVGLAAGAWLLLAAPALALTGDEPVTGQCDALVVDEAGELSPADEERVADAAAAFRTELSFEPRVWVLDQRQDGVDLASWIVAQETACGWRLENGAFRSNLVVLAVTTDEPGGPTGETFLWYGDAMPDAMDDEFTDIQADVINPRLSDGDYADGLVDGLDAVAAVIDPGPPTGLIALGGAAVLGGGGYVGYRIVRGRRERATARAALAARFETAATGSDRAVEQLDPLVETIDTDVQLVRASVHPDEAEPLLAEVATSLATNADLTTRRSDLVVWRDQVIADADDAALGKAVTDWERLQGESEALLPVLTHDRERLEHVLDLASSVTTRLAAVPGAVELVRAAEATARTQGFAPTNEVAPLASVPSRVAEVERLVADRRVVAADAALTGVETDLEESRVALTTLPERLADLTDRVETAHGRRAILPGSADDAREAEAVLVAQFHPAIAAEVAGSAAAAERDAARSDAALADARRSLDARDLGAAATALLTAEEALGQAETAAAAPGALLARVRQLATEVPTALAGLQSLVEQLQGRVRLGSPEAASVGALVGRLSAVSLADRPDWPRVDTEVRALATEAKAVDEQLTRAARVASQQRAAAAAAAAAASSNRGSGFWGSSGGTRSGGSFFSSSGSSSRRSGSSSSRSSSRSGGGGSRSSGGRRGGGSRR